MHIHVPACTCVCVNGSSSLCDLNLFCCNYGYVLTINLCSLNTTFVAELSQHVLMLCPQVYDMGRDGRGLSRVASMSMSTITHLALSALRTNQRTLINPVVKLSVIPSSESSTLHLLAVTQAGMLSLMLCVLIADVHVCMLIEYWECGDTPCSSEDYVDLVYMYV